MSNDLENPDEHQQSEQEPESPIISNLRKDRETAIAEAAAAKRELTLHRAGLGELSDKQMKALTAAHEGDWEPDAIKATATELGFVQSDTPKQDGPQIPADELASMARVQSAAGGTPPPPRELDTEPGLLAAIGAATNEQELKAVLREAGRLAE